MEWYILLFFRLLNFAAIIAAGWYLFTHYVSPELQEEIDKEEALALEKQKKQQLLEETVRIATDQIQKEQLFFATLKDRIITWKAIVQDKEQNRKKQADVLQNQLLDRFKTQQYQYDYSARQSAETEVVFHAVLDGIKKKYSNMTNKEQFTTLIIESIHSEKKNHV